MSAVNYILPSNSLQQNNVFPERKNVPKAIINGEMVLEGITYRSFGKHNQINFQKRTEYLNSILREVLPTIPGKYHAVVTLIIDRTISWGKYGEKITSEHFVKHCQWSKRTVERCIHYLKQHGIIVSIRVGKLTCYAIKKVMDDFIMALKTPKKEVQKRQGLATSKKDLQANEIQALTDEESNFSTATDGGSISNKKSISFRNTYSPSLRSDDLHEIDSTSKADKETTDAILKKTKDNIKAKAVAVRTKEKLNSYDVELVWKEAFKETFPSATYQSWTHKDKGMVNTMLKRFENHSDALNIIEYAVREWKLIMEKVFYWYSVPPAAPALGMIVKFIDKFQKDAYERRDSLQYFEPKYSKTAAIERTAEMKDRQRQLEYAANRLERERLAEEQRLNLGSDEAKKRRSAWDQEQERRKKVMRELQESSEKRLDAISTPRKPINWDE